MWNIQWYELCNKVISDWIKILANELLQIYKAKEQSYNVTTAMDLKPQVFVISKQISTRLCVGIFMCISMTSGLTWTSLPYFRPLRYWNVRELGQCWGSTLLFANIKRRKKDLLIVSLRLNITYTNHTLRKKRINP